jgi:hypothetical protein
VPIASPGKRVISSAAPGEDQAIMIGARQRSDRPMQQMAMPIDSDQIYAEICPLFKLAVWPA